MQLRQADGKTWDILWSAILGIVLFSTCWLAWQAIDAARQISFAGPWVENLFLGFFAAVYGLFAAFTFVLLLNELGLISLSGRKHKGRRA